MAGPLYGVFASAKQINFVMPATVALVHPGSVQSFDNIALFDTPPNKYVPNPVSMGPDTDQLYLVLYGTGIRHRTSDDNVTATVNGVRAQIQTAAQGVYHGWTR
jgi:hypothetical protein